MQTALKVISSSPPPIWCSSRDNESHAKNDFLSAMMLQLSDYLSVPVEQKEFVKVGTLDYYWVVDECQN
jgi:hypothetical protein